MRYAYIEGEFVRFIVNIKENQSIYNCYSKDFISHCKVCDEGVEVGMRYKNGAFSKVERYDFVEEPNAEVTQEDINLDLDYRLTCIELGL